MQVGEDMRMPGDLVPEAAVWPFLTGYVRDGHVAPVLVATLPEDAQLVLMEWESEQQGALVGSTNATPPAQAGTSTTGDQPTAKSTAKKEKVA